MARIGLFNAEQTRWLRFDSDTEICIRFLNKEDLTEITKKAIKRAKMTGADHDRVSNQLVGAAAVKGWRNAKNHNHPGLLNADGAPIPFTDENRDMLMRYCREFSNFVNDAAIDSKRFLEQEEEAAEEAELVEELKND